MYDRGTNLSTEVDAESASTFGPAVFDTIHPAQRPAFRRPRATVSRSRFNRPDSKGAEAYARPGRRAAGSRRPANSSRSREPGRRGREMTAGRQSRLRVEAGSDVAACGAPYRLGSRTRCAIPQTSARQAPCPGRISQSFAHQGQSLPASQRVGGRALGTPWRPGIRRLMHPAS